MAPDADIDAVKISEAVRRQADTAEEHDLGLIEACLRLSPEQRLERLTAWIAFVASARPVADPAPGGRR